MGVMSVFMAILQTGSVLMFIVLVGIEDHADSNELTWCCLGPCCHQILSDLSDQCFQTEPGCITGPSCCLRAISWVFVQQQLGSVLISVASVNSQGHKNHEWWNQKAILDRSHPLLAKPLAHSGTVWKFSSLFPNLAFSDLQQRQGVKSPVK